MNETTKPPYEVGYCKPPAHTRFQKGMSGNPRGRRRAEPEDQILQVLQNEGDRLVIVRQAGERVLLRGRRAMIRALVMEALKGNSKAVRVVIHFLTRIEAERRIEEAARGEIRAKKDASEEMLRELRAYMTEHFSKPK